MDKKKDIVGGSETPVVTTEKVTTTPPAASIGATTPAQSEEEQSETQQTPPQTMPAQPQPTRVAPTAPSLAAQPPGEEYNERPQTPPTTPAPAVTTTAPQYDDTDRRNQANLAAQTTTTPADNETKVLQFDEAGNPILVNADVVTPKITPKPTDTAPATDATPSTDGVEYHTYRDILAKLAPQTSDEEKRKQMRRERRKAIVSALGDGLSALSNLYFTTKGAPDQGLKPGMTDAAKKRMDDLRAQWKKEKDKYQELMLKGLEMDRTQGNWLKSYELQKNADKRAEEKFAKEMPMLEKEMAMLDEKIRKLKDDNDLDEKTKADRIAVAQAELEAKKRDYDYRKTHHGFSEKEDIERQDKERHHRESLAASRSGGGGRSGKTYRIYNYNSTSYSDLTPDEVNRLYAALYSDGKVGKYSSLNDKVEAIQRYHSLKNDTYEVEVPVYYEDKDGNKKIRKYIKETRRYKNRKDDAANGGRYDKMSTWTTFNGGNKSNGTIKINY